MAGLDPAIHLQKSLLRQEMDARVKPAHDAFVGSSPRVTKKVA
jgi:hypothetical protein